MNSLLNVFIALLGAGQLILSYETRLLYQFPEPSQYAENIIIRSTGDLVLTTWGRGGIYILNPRAKDKTPELVEQAPVNSLTGITETDMRDVFAIAGGNRELDDYHFDEGSAMVMTVNMSTKYTPDQGPRIETIAKIPQSGLLTGMASIPGRPNFVFIADPLDYCLRLIDLKTGAHQVAHRLSKFRSEQISYPGAGAIGINGLKIRGDYLYFTNTGRRTFARMKVDSWGNQEKAAKILLDLKEEKPMKAPHDFALSENDTAYIATYPDTVIKFSRHKKWADSEYKDYIVEKKTMQFHSPTAVALSKDEKFLYLTTRGTNEVGGQIVEIQLQ